MAIIALIMEGLDVAREECRGVTNRKWSSLRCPNSPHIWLWWWWLWWWLSWYHNMMTIMMITNRKWSFKLRCPIIRPHLQCQHNYESLCLIIFSLRIGAKIWGFWWLSYVWMLTLKFQFKFQCGDRLALPNYFSRLLLKSKIIFWFEFALQGRDMFSKWFWIFWSAAGL